MRVDLDAARASDDEHGHWSSPVLFDDAAVAELLAAGERVVTGEHRGHRDARRLGVMIGAMAHPSADDLARIPLLDGLSAPDRDRLAGWFEVEEVAAGRRPVADHSSGYAFFVLAAGRARVERDGKVLNTLQPGDVFGEMAFFADDGRRHADVIAETDVMVYSLFGTHFREIQTELPEVAARLEALVQQRTATNRALEGEVGG